MWKVVYYWFLIEHNITLLYSHGLRNCVNSTAGQATRTIPRKQASRVRRRARSIQPGTGRLGIAAQAP